MAAVAEKMAALSGTRHVSVAEMGDGVGASVTADVRAETADEVLATLERLGVPADDVALFRFETIGPSTSTDEPTALVWAEVLGRARAQ